MRWFAAPGQVIGMDMSPVEIDRARRSADQQMVINVRFETGDIGNVLPNAGLPRPRD